MSLPKYPAYKDSGVSWLGEVPAHWEVKKLKHLATLTTGLTPQSDNPIFYSDDGFPWVRPEDLSENQLVSASKFLSDEGCALVRKIKPFSTLICCIGTIGKIGYVGVEASTNQQITAASFYGYPRYFFYQAISAREIFEQSATGNVIKILNSERLGSVSFICPSYDEQVLVAHFLDRETAKIDALIAEQEKLIALLAEKRQATISRAVTRGLDPKVPLKDSGVPWLGKVPAHWEVKALRRVVSLNPSKSEVAHFPKDSEVSFLPMEAIGENGDLILDRFRKLSEVETGYTYFRNGDVTIAKITPCFENGKGGVMTGLLNGFGFGTTELIVVRPNLSFISSGYLNCIFRSKIFRLEGEGSMYGAGGQKRVSDDFVRNLIWAIPPASEQLAIERFINTQSQQFELLKSNAQTGISLLKERRAALISAAVTGKIDVRGLAA